MDDEKAVRVALLHDIVKDTVITFEDLEREGVSGEIICALRLLTHDPAVPYTDYVCKINREKNATKMMSVEWDDSRPDGILESP